MLHILPNISKPKPWWYDICWKFSICLYKLFCRTPKVRGIEPFFPWRRRKPTLKNEFVWVSCCFLCKPGHVGSSEVEMRLLAVVFDYEDCDTSATKPTCKITIVNILIFIYGQHFLFPTIFCQQLLGHWISPGCSVGCLLDMQSNCLFQYIWCSLTVETQLAMLTLPLGCIHFTWWNRKMTPDMG